MMKLKTAVSLIKSGKLLLLLRLKHLYLNFYRLSFLASMSDTTLLKKFAKGPVSKEELTKGCEKNPSVQTAAEAWLDLGLELGLFKKNSGGYALHGFLAKKFAAPENDAIRALVREIADLHNLYIMKTPSKLEQGLLWSPDDQNGEYGDLIARSSQTLAPFIFEVIDRFFSKSGDIRLLEVGCGYASYMIYAANKNNKLSAVGLELDSHVAGTANINIYACGLQDRIEIGVTDVREYQTDALFDIITLYNNIYYFPVKERIELLKQLRLLLKPGGQILLTTGCRKGGIEFQLVNLIHAATKGWGRLPDKNEMLQQLSQAGFQQNCAINLIPGDKYYAFAGLR